MTVKVEVGVGQVVVIEDMGTMDRGETTSAAGALKGEGSGKEEAERSKWSGGEEEEVTRFETTEEASNE